MMVSCGNDQNFFDHLIASSLKFLSHTAVIKFHGEPHGGAGGLTTQGWKTLVFSIEIVVYLRNGTR